MSDSNDTYVSATAQIVSSYLAHNRANLDEVEQLIERVHGKLQGLGGGAPRTTRQTGAEPAAPKAKQSLPSGVTIENSIQPDYIVCLEDGKKLKMLKRYLKTNFDMMPDEYRKRWNLPSTYPMVAPNYAEKRSRLAKEIGLGKKPVAANAAAPKNRSAEAPRQPLAKPKGELPKGGKLKIVKSTDVMKAH